MVRIVRGTLTVLLAALLIPTAGCDSAREAFKSAVRQVASATPLGVTARVDVTPVNADQVARFADEQDLKDEDPVPLKAAVTNVVEEPGSPKALVVLSKGTEVTKIAQRGNSFLVVFENPQKRGEMLIGWVPERALVSETPAAPKPVALSCAAGLQLLGGDPDFCARVCSDDAACGAEGRCTGSASLAGNPVRFCVAKLEQKAEFVQKPAKASIKKPEERNNVSPARERVSVTPPVTPAARCSPTCTATCDCSGRPITCSPTCTDTCDCSGRPITCSPTCTATCDCSGRPRVAAVARCSPTCTATCDCSGRPITCSPTCTDTCDCSGRPITCSPTCTDTCDCSGRPIAVARCSPTCTATCDCSGRPITCSPTCTATCDCSGRPITCSPTCTATCDCSGRPITCAPTCTDTCDCSGRPISVARCSPTCTDTCDCDGRPITCAPTCTDTCDCDGRPIKTQKRARTREDGVGVSRKR